MLRQRKVSQSGTKGHNQHQWQVPENIGTPLVWVPKLGGHDDCGGVGHKVFEVLLEWPDG